MAFSTIAIAPGLSKKQHRRAARLGPRAVASNRSIGDLMEVAHFGDVRCDDVTAEFDRTARAWGEGYADHEHELRTLLGDELDELRKRRRDLIAGIGEGLLQRFIVSGSKPGSGSAEPPRTPRRGR